jgi:hypothetical protein
MLILSSTSDLLRVTTSASSDVDVHASWVDNASGAITPGRTNTAAITTATTTTVVASPAASTQRTVQALLVRNVHASTSNDITIVHTDGTNAQDVYKTTLAAGESLHYHEATGFTRYTASGIPVAPGNAGAADVQVFNGSGGTWSKPAGAQVVVVEMYGAGGGGGAGASLATAVVAKGGGGGGGGAYIRGTYAAVSHPPLACRGAGGKEPSR